MPRFSEFTFKAPRDANGIAMYSLPTVPTRDLTAEDVRLLSREQYEDVKAAKLPNGKPLFEPVRADSDDGDESEEEPAAEANADLAGEEFGEPAAEGISPAE